MSKSKKISLRMRIVGFLLAPFVGIIRYGALKIMKRFRQPNDGRPIIATANHLLDELILPDVFKTFISSEFRETAGFDELSQAEQDRIFNELEMAGVCLALFCLDFADSIARPEDIRFWLEVRQRLPQQLRRMFLGLGVDKSNADLMRKLVDMRCEEYEEMTREARDMWNMEEPLFGRLPTAAAKHSVARVHAIAIGTALHIRRGKLKKHDPLSKFLRDWLLKLNEDIGKFIFKL